ncbi:MAG: hypothetical protein ABJH05_01205 [Fulvivirga sp.]
MKFFMLLAQLFFITYAFSQEVGQLSKGSKVVGGGISGEWILREYPTNSDGTQNINRRSLTIRPASGEFIKDKLLLGVEIIASIGIKEENINNSLVEYEDNEEFLNYKMGMFFVKYFPLINKFGFFAKPGVSVNFENRLAKINNFSLVDDQNSFSRKAEFHSFGLNGELNFGLYLLIGKQFSIETNLGGLGFYYSKESETVQDVDFESSNFNLRLVNELSLDQILTLNYFFD